MYRMEGGPYKAPAPARRPLPKDDQSQAHLMCSIHHGGDAHDTRVPRRT